MSLRSNIEAVLQYVQSRDSDTLRLLSTRQADDTTPVPKVIMKHWKVQEVFRKQLHHVDKGCLTDPSIDMVNIYRRNPKTDVTYVSRGTNTNERDNLDLATNILTATHIGE